MVLLRNEKSSPLENLIDGIGSEFEEKFIEMEGPFREHVLSRYFEQYSKISLGISLSQQNSTEFYISLNLFFEDWNNGTPLSIEKAGLKNPEGVKEDLLIPSTIEMLGDRIHEDMCDLAENGAESGHLKLPKEIGAAIMGEESPFEFYGTRCRWNDEEIS